MVKRKRGSPVKSGSMVKTQAQIPFLCLLDMSGAAAQPRAGNRSVEFLAGFPTKKDEEPQQVKAFVGKKTGGGLS